MLLIGWQARVDVFVTKDSWTGGNSRHKFGQQMVRAYNFEISPHQLKSCTIMGLGTFKVLALIA